MNYLRTKAMCFLVVLMANIGVFAIGIEYVTVIQDEVCGNDGRIRFQINDFEYGQDFEFSLDGGQTWELITHDVMYSGIGYTENFLTAGNYYFRVRVAGTTSYVNYSGNPVVVNSDPLPTPEITGY